MVSLNLSQRDSDIHLRYATDKDDSSISPCTIDHR